MADQTMLLNLLDRLAEKSIMMDEETKEETQEETPEENEE